MATFPKYRVAAHHEMIATALESVERGDITRLIITVPPRHGKSELSSIRFPAWYLGRNPDCRIIACSYSAPLVEGFSRQARNLIKSPEYGAVFPGVSLAQDSRSISSWDLSAPLRGGYIAAGVGGAVTGRGAHVLLIDDPVKDYQDAASETIRQYVWDWYRTTAYTRLEEHGAIVLIMTRWHEDDLAGKLLAAQAADPDADQWHVLDLRAIAEDGDALGRAADQPLWPDKYPFPVLKAIRQTLGEQHWNAVYQGRPSPAEGGMFKRDWWKRFDLATFDRATCKMLIQVWDTAFSEKTSADYSVCATWAQTPTGLYLLHVYRERVDFPDLKRVARDLYNKYRPNAVLIENKASGQSLIQELRRPDPTDPKRFPALPVIAVDVTGKDGDKVARATAETPYVEAGMCHLPEGMTWVDLFIDEHAAFPNGAHDDMVDTTIMALKRLVGTPNTATVLKAIPRPVPSPWTSGARRQSWHGP